MAHNVEVTEYFWDVKKTYHIFVLKVIFKECKVSDELLRSDKWQDPAWHQLLKVFFPVSFRDLPFV